MFEEAGFGAAHAVDGAAEHGLDREVVVWAIGVTRRAEGGFDGVDVGDVGFVGSHPAADAGVEFLKVLDYESAAGVVAVGTDSVEGEDQGVAEFLDVGAEPERGRVGKVSAGDQFGGDGFGCGPESSGYGAVRTNQRAGVVKAQRAEDAHGVGVTATSGDDDLDTGRFGGEKGAKISWTNLAAVAEQSAIHVNGDHADAGIWCCLQGTPSPRT